MATIKCGTMWDSATHEQLPQRTPCDLGGKINTCDGSGRDGNADAEYVVFADRGQRPGSDEDIALCDACERQNAMRYAHLPPGDRPSSRPIGQTDYGGHTDYEPPTHGTTVVTYQTPRGLRFSLCRPCTRVLRAEDNWPGDSSGSACDVYFGGHYGYCGCHRHNQIAAAAQAESR